MIFVNMAEENIVEDPKTELIKTPAKGSSQVAINLNHETIGELGKVLIDYQKEVNNKSVKEIEARMPLMKREQILKYTVVFIILIAVIILSYFRIIEAQVTVALLTAILTYVCTKASIDHIKEHKSEK